MTFEEWMGNLYKNKTPDDHGCVFTDNITKRTLRECWDFQQGAINKLQKEYNALESKCLTLGRMFFLQAVKVIHLPSATRLIAFFKGITEEDYNNECRGEAVLIRMDYNEALFELISRGAVTDGLEPVVEECFVETAKIMTKNKSQRTT